jgi:hypothetical protein
VFVARRKPATELASEAVRKDVLPTKCGRLRMKMVKKLGSEEHDTSERR